MAVLEILSARGDGSPYPSFNLGRGEVTIGRDHGNTIKLDDAQTSRTHAKISLTPLGYLLADCHSANGTWVGEKSIIEHVLKDGDVFRVGQTLIRFLEAETKATVVAPLPAVPFGAPESQFRSAVTEPPPAPARAAATLCPGCGMALSPGVRFCNRCGLSLQGPAGFPPPPAIHVAQAPAPRPRPAPRKMGKGCACAVIAVLIVLFFFAVVCLAFAAYYFGLLDA
jgi:hypothetical protein